MAPSALSDVQEQVTPVQNGHSKTPHREPLKISGALGQFSYEETTPILGREYLNVNIVDDLLKGENADERLRDLAITSKHPIPSKHCQP